MPKDAQLVVETILPQQFSYHSSHTIAKTERMNEDLPVNRVSLKHKTVKAGRNTINLRLSKENLNF